MSIKPLTIIAIALGTLGAAIACSSQASERTAATSAKPAATAVTPAVLERGKSLYVKNCAPCHGASGKGDGPAAGVLKPPPRDHTDREYMKTLTDEDMGKVIQIGGAIKNKPLMPGNPQIKGADLEAVIAYVRSLSAPK